MKGTYAIVDLETTGASPVYGRIIEVGILRVEDGTIVRRYESLVNPGRYVNPAIELLTGITNEALEDAPAFGEIAGDVVDLLDGAVFVAHNARFDYSFLRAELARLGIAFSARCLCSMKLSRKLFPRYRHHDLDSVIVRHGFTCEHRHRAMGDAEAVYEFLRVVQATLPAERLSAAVNEILRTSSLPAGIDRSMIERLPEAPGVYLFFGRDGELLYVGKSKNIKGRVLAHFSQDHRSGKELEMCQAVNSIEARPTAGELGALLLESRLIKELRPLFNSMARRIRKLVAASMRMNKQGYAVISLEEVESINPHRGAPVMGVFRSMKLGREFLERITKSHRLCPKLLGLERAKEHCFAYQLKQCDGACVGEEPADAYNARVEAAFAERRIRTWPYRGGVVIEEKEGAAGEGEVFLVDQWCLLSSLKYSRYGTECRPQQNPTFDYDSYKILLRYLLNRVNRKNIRVVARGEFDRLVQTLEDSAGAGA